LVKTSVVVRIMFIVLCHLGNILLLLSIALVDWGVLELVVLIIVWIRILHLISRRLLIAHHHWLLVLLLMVLTLRIRIIWVILVRLIVSMDLRIRLLLRNKLLSTKRIHLIRLLVLHLVSLVILLIYWIWVLTGELLRHHVLLKWGLIHPYIDLLLILSRQILVLSLILLLLLFRVSLLGCKCFHLYTYEI
jgi:hypothetical protein